MDVADGANSVVGRMQVVKEIGEDVADLTEAAGALPLDGMQQRLEQV